MVGDLINGRSRFLFGASGGGQICEFVMKEGDVLRWRNDMRGKMMSPKQTLQASMINCQQSSRGKKKIEKIQPTHALQSTPLRLDATQIALFPRVRCAHIHRLKIIIAKNVTASSLWRFDSPPFSLVLFVTFSSYLL